LHRHDHVAALEPLLGRVAVRADRGDHDPAGSGRQVERPRDLRSDRLQRQAEHLARRSGRAAFRPAGSSPAKLSSELLFGRPLFDATWIVIRRPLRITRRGPWTRPRIGDQVGDRLVRVHFLAADRNYDIALLDPGLRRRSVGLDRSDDLAAVLRQAKRFGDVVVDRLKADAQITALRPLAAAQRVDDGLCKLGRNGKADADVGAGRRDQSAC
jgi:hypothetical protein